MDKSIPEVNARFVPSRGYERAAGLIVDKCPYCGKSHRHTYSSQHGRFLGTRMADCLQGEYMLVDDEENHG